MKEAIIQGPHGPQTVVLSMDEDMHIEEEIEKIETVAKGSQAIAAADHPQSSEIVESSSGSGHHHLGHKTN